MIINLNKKLVTKSLLLIHLQDIDIYRFYTGKEVSLNGVMKSPLREDNKESFGYFIGENNEICFNDFVLGGGDFVKFVQLRFGLNFFEALSKIVVDFNLTDKFHYKKSEKTSKEYNPTAYTDRKSVLNKANNFRLGKKFRKWTLLDVKFWSDFGIDMDTLKKYNVTPISYVFINGQPILAEKYAYCFTEYKDKKETYKIYQPFSTKYKWLNNHDDSVWQGWSQLPEKGDNLIITKSLKDVMAIDNLLNMPTLSLQTEAITPKTHIIQQLKSRFKRVSLLYDNDFDKKENWGRKFSTKLCSKFDLIRLEIPDKFESKDFSDLVKNYGREEIKEIWETCIDIPF